MTYAAHVSVEGRAVPLWRSVLADLRRRLDTGEFTERFPGDHDLAAHYGVSRHTVREAVRHLEAEGRLTRQRGRGSFVTERPLEQSLGTLYSLFQSIEAQGLRQDSVVRRLDERSDDRAQAMLGLGDGEAVIYLERVRLAEGEPFAWDCSWLPAVLARPLLDVDFQHTALYEELRRRCGVSPTRGWDRICPALPDRHQRTLLELGATDPVFAIERATFSGDRPLEWRHTIVRGDRFAFLARWADGTARGTFEAR
jgi:GntR family transcriptional regulator